MSNHRGIHRTPGNLVDGFVGMFDRTIKHPNQMRPIEKRLLFAVLEVALRDIENAKGLDIFGCSSADDVLKKLARGKRRDNVTKNFVTALAWVFPTEQRDREWPFSFESVCATLELSAEYLRRLISDWYDRGGKPRPQTFQVVQAPENVFGTIEASDGVVEEAIHMSLDGSARVKYFLAKRPIFLAEDFEVIGQRLKEEVINRCLVQVCLDDALDMKLNRSDYPPLPRYFMRGVFDNLIQEGFFYKQEREYVEVVYPEAEDEEEEEINATGTAE